MKRGSSFLLAGVAVLAAAAFLVFRSPGARGVNAGATGSGHATEQASKDVPPPPRPSPRPANSSLPELPPPAQPPQAAGSPANEKWADQRAEELEKLSWFEDAASLHKILAELYSPLPEVRAAALAATRAFGSKDALPYLEQAENGTSDPLERKTLADAIEYLKLPKFLDEQVGEPEPEE
ncbi:MAG: hypothetical protein EOP88_05205 [Verrucomicrobiaceae bacterium]|nr:MAG: hypothetical protein EOP88_05205 [Verrucomicrobiaceae bacterium]